MQPHVLTMVGLVADIAGAFLLSVEAIKVQNLLALREWILGPFHEVTRSPSLTITETTVISERSSRYVVVFSLLHNLVGFLVLVALNWLLGGRLYSWLHRGGEWLVEKPWYIIGVVLTLFAVYGCLFGLWAIGECVHAGITWSTRRVVSLLNFIVSRTPAGTIGIIGFAFLFLGFGLQFVATCLTAHPG